MSRFDLISFISLFLGLLGLIGIVILIIIKSENPGNHPTVQKLTQALDNRNEVILSWELNEDQTHITFDLWAKTTGFVGFGVSPNGGMAGADIFLAGVYPNGTAYSTDRFSSGNSLPTVDSSQDWILLEANENGTWTYLRFSRPLNTCDDKEDYSISNDTNWIIWAVGQTDNFGYHGSWETNRSTSSLTLFPVTSEELNTEEFQIWEGILDMEMPSQDTAYWCSLHKGPPTSEKQLYIVGLDAIISNEHAERHIHHFLLYDCFLPEDGSMDETFENLTVTNGFNGQLCHEVYQSIPVSYCNKHILYVWDKGNKGLVYPDNVAYPIGKLGTKTSKYFLLEIHYDNPEKVENLKFPVGAKIFYTDKPRLHEADLTLVMHDTNMALIVPPNTQDYVVAGHCSSECTRTKFPAEGILVFNVVLHSHLSGKKLILRHFRGNVELPWISRDDNFDLNFQHMKRLPKAVKVLPGDQITYECTYDSTWKKGQVVVGGPTTRDEMCQAWVWYYPKVDDFFACASTYNLQQSFTDYNITKWTTIKKGQIWEHQVEKPSYLAGEFEDSMNHKFNWTEDFKVELEKKRRFGDHDIICGNPANPVEGVKASYPHEVKKFFPERICTRNEPSDERNDGILGQF